MTSPPPEPSRDAGGPDATLSADVALLLHAVMAMLTDWLDHGTEEQQRKALEMTLKHLDRVLWQQPMTNPAKDLKQVLEITGFDPDPI